MLQGYVVTVVAWLFWSQYVSSLLLSCGQYVSSVLTKAPSEEPKKDTGVSVKRLLQYLLPYCGRFVVVLLFVAFSAYCKWEIFLFVLLLTKQVKIV